MDTNQQSVSRQQDPKANDTKAFESLLSAASHPQVLTMRMKSTVIILVAFASITGCLANATFSLANLSPDSPPVNVYLNGHVIYSNLTFGRVGQFTTQVSGGTYLIDITVAETNKTLLSVLVPLHVDQVICLVNPMKYLNLEAYRFFVPDQSHREFANIVFVHTSPNVPPVDVVYVSKNNETTVQFPFLQYLQMSSNDSKFAGNYTFKINLAGTKTSILQLDAIQLTGGGSYIVFIDGLVGSPVAGLNATIFSSINSLPNQ